MIFGHERLDVYRAALDYVSWSFKLSKHLTGPHRSTRDQLLRSSQSVAQNIAEGNGKTSHADRRRYFEIARGSSLECAASQDILEVCEAISPNTNREGKVLLHRIVAMLTKMASRGPSDPSRPSTEAMSRNRS